MAKASGRNRYLRRGGGGGGGQRGRADQMAEAQAMLQRAQEQLAAQTVEGSAGGGAVRVTMNGEQKVRAVKVDADDVEMLEDLIVAAIHDAAERASALQADSLGMLTGGMAPPGLDG